MVGFDINWTVLNGNPLLSHPTYQKYYLQNLGAININEVKDDFSKIMLDNNSGPIMSYLAWIIRCHALAG